MRAITTAKPATSLPAATAIVAAAIRTYRTWRQRRRQRLSLAKLDARMLSDIGVHPDAARHETRKPFWQP